MQSGHIYIFKATGQVYEGIFVTAINGTYVFRSLPFYNAELCPRTVASYKVEWAVRVCEDDCALTESAYNKALSKLK